MSEDDEAQGRALPLPAAAVRLIAFVNVLDELPDRLTAEGIVGLSR